MKPIQITVCIPLYNGIEFLPEAVASVQQQTYPHWTAIIGVNGHGRFASTVYNKVKEIVAGDPRFAVVNYPEARNVAEVNNRMVKDATTDSATEWIAHLDADDVWLPQKLEKQVQALQGGAKEALVLGTECVYFGNSDKKPPIKTGWVTRGDLFQLNHVINSSTLLHKSVAKYNNRFYGCEDYDLWLRLSMTDVAIYNLPEVLVKHRIHDASQFNTSRKQDVESLRKFYLPITYESFTLVTAFYDIPSKFSAQQYFTWIKPFFTEYRGPMIIYTEEKYKHFFTELCNTPRKQVRVVPPEMWEANTKFPPGFWETQKQKDPEAVHTPELYKIWYEKHIFVKRAIQENPFQHTKFMWCDAGVCRTETIRYWITGMANQGARIVKDKMTLLQINPFTEDDHRDFEYDGVVDFTERKNRLGGGVLAGGVEAWQKWSDHIQTVMETMLKRGMFVGKDQSVFNNIALQYPNDVCLIPTDRSTGNDNYWFYLLYYFSCDYDEFIKLVWDIET